jgi:L-iditol 2-dehydrogenase
MTRTGRRVTAAFVGSSGHVTLRNVAQPQLQRGDLLVKLRACGVCGTDLEKLHRRAVTNVVLGHEVVGEVVEADAASPFQPGERVFPHHHAPCYACYYCTHGAPTQCPDFRRTNLDPCGFASHFRVPAWNVQHGGVLRIPDGLSDAEATFVEPLGTCIRALNAVGFQPGDDVLVLGCGPMGLLHLKLLHARGAKLRVATDVIPARLRFARDAGADRTLNAADPKLPAKVAAAFDGHGPDVVIVAAGSSAALHQGLDLVRDGGRVCLFGAPPRGARLAYDASQLFVRGVRLIASYSTSDVETQEALAVLERGIVQVKPLVTHRFPLMQIGRAFRTAASAGRAMKVIVTS